MGSTGRKSGAKNSRKNKGSKLPGFVNVTKYAIPIVVFVLLASVLYFGGIYVFMKSEYFTVTKISIISQEKSADVVDAFKSLGVINVCKGKNVFKVDIKRIARIIKRDFPGLKDVQVGRRLPNGIDVRIWPRLPVCMINGDGLIPVDANGYVLSSKIRLPPF